MPRVTVIVPNYNHASFLETRLKSILNQTYQDFEVIFLDDGSSDDSSSVFAGFSCDRRITSVFSETNGGIPFKQWNKGVRLARGEYIWIAESDDYADDHFLASLVSFWTDILASASRIAIRSWWLSTVPVGSGRSHGDGKPTLLLTVAMSARVD